MLVPKLRFKREDGTEYPEWSNQRFANAFAPLNNNTFSRDMLSESGSVCNIHYGDILVKYGEVCDIQKENTPKVNNDIDTGKYDLLQDGDIILADTAEDETVGKAIEIYHIGTSKVVSGLHTMACRPNDKYAPKYMGYYINSPTYHNQLLPFMQGIKVTSIGRRNISDTVIYYPADMEEQQKIADFLSTVDEVIAQSEAEVQNLEQQKKAAMQKIFSQEVRFKREDGTEHSEWEYARIDEIAEINPKTSAALPDCFYYMDLGSVSMGAWREKTITDKDNAPSRANRLASVGDVFFQSVRPYNMGHFFFEKEYDLPVVASTGFIQLRAKKGYCNGFIYQLLYEDRFNAEVNTRCTGSNYPAINSDNFANIEMLIPCLEEQQKIADFLSAYDEAISYAKQELELWKQFKKGMLQQMFV